MKKHKIEIAAMTLLLGVLCYAMIDNSFQISKQDIVLESSFLKMGEIKKKEDITKEMLSIPNEELQEEKEETKGAVETNSDVEVNAKYMALPQTEEPYNEIISNQIVNYALNFEGNPYVYGGNSLTSGTDCSGFTKLIYAEYGIYLSRSAPEQASSGKHIPLESIMPGDIVVSGYDGVVCHASIYIGNGKLIHALNSNVGIVVTDMYIMPIIDVRRVI